MYKRTGKNSTAATRHGTNRLSDEEGIKQARGFKQTFSRTVAVEFMGVWYVKSLHINEATTNLARQGHRFIRREFFAYRFYPSFTVNMHRDPSFPATCHSPAQITSCARFGML